jgi:hypothetical protein
VEIPDAYCQPRRGVAGSTQPSVLQDLCPQLKPYVLPANEPPPPVVAKPKMQTPKARIIKPGAGALPPAVAKMVADGAADDPREEG